MATEQLREKTAFTFQIDDVMNTEIEEVVSKVPGLTKSLLARTALNDKLREIKRKLDAGEEVAVTI